MNNSSVNGHSNGVGANINCDVLVIGGGFGGCYALHGARKAGYRTKLLEAGSDFGGVWHFNSYPGARVDSETPLYQLDLPEVWNTFNFTQKYPGHEELKAYFAHMTEVLDLRKDALFNARVISAAHDQDSNRWHIKTAAGHHATAKYVIFATGTTNKPFIPQFPDVDAYQGQRIHPAAWPKDVQVKGKKVAIIGQGASGLQILQDLAKEDCEITVFVRNPAAYIRMNQSEISEKRAEETKTVYQCMFERGKYNSETGYQYNIEPRKFHEVSPEERHEHYERLWAWGGFCFFNSNFPDFAWDKTANAELYQFWAKKVRARITDPVKRELMAPLEQRQWIGTKRPSLEVDYYEMIDQPNVRLVDVKTTPIKSFTESGMVIDNETQEALDFDIVVFATGYDSVTGSVYDMCIQDKNGVMLQKKWENGIRTYLGTMVPDLPNAFLLYGPQSPASLANGPPFLELQVDWVMKVLDGARKEGFSTVEPSADASEKWSAELNGVYQHLLQRETPSWWNGSNIPGKKQEPLIWAGGLRRWREWCDGALKDWSQFNVTK